MVDSSNGVFEKNGEHRAMIYTYHRQFQHCLFVSISTTLICLILVMKTCMLIYFIFVRFDLFVNAVWLLFVELSPSLRKKNRKHKYELLKVNWYRILFFTSWIIYHSCLNTPGCLYSDLLFASNQESTWQLFDYFW